MATLQASEGVTRACAGYSPGMCGRFSLDDKSTDLAGFFEAEDNFHSWLPACSIAPTDVVPIIRERADKASGEVRRTVDEAVWDFHPDAIG